MKERPIPFRAPMVRAILGGTKTLTRRVVKPQPTGAMPEGWSFQNLGVEGWYPVNGANRGAGIGRCPYGQPGDLMWVREAWRAMSEHDALKPSVLQPGTPVVYEASRHPDNLFGKLRPGMFMPRWASRITLEVTGVRVERLGDISEADAIAEGIGTIRVSENDSRWLNYCDPEDRSAAFGDPRYSFWSLWESINGQASHDANPWVWVVEFRRLTP